jgi:CHAT domain-containing protein
MPIQVNSPGWRIRRAAGTRGVAGASAAVDLPGLPPEFLAAESRVAEEAVLEPAPATRGRAPAAAGLDITYDLEPGQTALLAIRHPSGALTFHQPVQSVSRGVRAPSEVRFQVALRPTPATRGLVGNAVKAIVVKVAKIGADKAVSFVLPRLVEAFERRLWKKRGLKEGWVKVSKESLAAGTLQAARPMSPARSLLFVHGTFSNTASAYRALAASGFFERVQHTYDDRIFGFDHFTLSRTPEENARMLLEALPEHATTFDVITHSRGGLVLRNIVERSAQFGAVSRRFTLGRAVLVASPNDGTPLATPTRWDETVGWIANLLEMFPDNPFTTGAAFVANGLVWLANHASGDIPGLHSMDGDGDPILTIQGPPGPPAAAYSALVANYQPTGQALQRLLDIGIDQFFGTANDLVVPSEGGWRVDRAVTGFIPGSRIGCFGPGGNLGPDSVTHVNFFAQPAAVDFLTNALLGRQQPLNSVDPRRSLPDRRLLRGMSDAPAAVTAHQGTVASAPAARGVPAEDAEPLRISVTNGDLTFEPEALMLGHYHAMQLTGTERVMDRLIGGTMTRSLERGVYPVAIGSHQIFINSRPNLERGSFMPRPKAVIIVGLGEEGKLRGGDLVQSVRQAVIAWAQRLSENKKQPASFDLAATLLGSGGTGVTPGDAARLVAQGVHEANLRLQGDEAGERTAPQVHHLHFIELYLDRATEAWRSLRMQEAATPGRYAVDDAVKRGTGPLERPPDSGYRGAEFDFISVEARPDKNGSPTISYTLDTRRARSEVRGQRAQSQLLTELVATASNDQNRDQQIGRTLFNLLIPVELEPYLAGSGEMQIELDPQTAKIPWELLDTQSETDTDTDLPWAIRVKLLRKLRIQEFRERVTDAAADASALVIGEPACPPEYPRLFGARSEAIAVRTALKGDGALDVMDLISEDAADAGANARAVVNALFEKPWRIVHIAGHGIPGQAGTPGGVVLSNGTFLGPDEFRNMRTVPELVFVNCCHLGGADAAQLLNTRYDRADFASGVAGALISIGVRCVVAAGWAVDDDAASVFAEEFYGSLLRGSRFIAAVGQARAAARACAPHVNTWAAYQCYGDPDWVFRDRRSDPNRAAEPRVDDFSGVASATALKLALEQIIVRTRFQGANIAEQIANLTQLEKLFGSKWGGIGRIAELFGEAFLEAGEVETGVRWYERAVEAPDAKATIKAAEQLANVRARLAWEIVDTAMRHLDAMKAREKGRERTAGARAAARRARMDAERALRTAVTRADDLIDRSLELLEKLVAIEQTMERASLIGSAYKRRALVDGAAGRRARVRRDLQQMKASYVAAQKVAEKNGASDVYYPVANRLTADVALHAGTPRWRSLDKDTVKLLRTSLQEKSATDPDFWSVVGETEIDQYEALAGRKLARVHAQLSRAYEDLHKRVTATRMWASVYDTACLVLPNYASRAKGRERTAAMDLLAQLRGFAHPQEEADAQ